MLWEIIIIGSVVFLAVVLHEYAHGWVAYKLGDPTAKLAGRLTLNPLNHIDPVGTILLPGILILLEKLGFNTFVIGWAKPVPVNFRALRNPKRDMIWVAMAGPLVNIFIAMMGSLVLKLNLNSPLKDIVTFAVFINLLLAIFNLVPIPPLDGSRLVMGLLPNSLARMYARVEPYGIGIVMVLLYFGLFTKLVLPIITLVGEWLGVYF